MACISSAPTPPADPAALTQLAWLDASLVCVHRRPIWTACSVPLLRLLLSAAHRRAMSRRAQVPTAASFPARFLPRCACAHLLPPAASAASCLNNPSSYQWIRPPNASATRGRAPFSFGRAQEPPPPPTAGQGLGGHAALSPAALAAALHLTQASLQEIISTSEMARRPHYSPHHSPPPAPFPAPIPPPPPAPIRHRAVCGVRPFMPPPRRPQPALAYGVRRRRRSALMAPAHGHCIGPYRICAASKARSCTGPHVFAQGCAALAALAMGGQRTHAARAPCRAQVAPH